MCKNIYSMTIQTAKNGCSETNQSKFLGQKLEKINVYVDIIIKLIHHVQNLKSVLGYFL